MNDLPDIPAHPDCDVSDMPMPHEMIVELSREAFGSTEEQTIATLRSIGMTRVPGGWVMGPAGNG